jgi:hypothetical protein
LYNRKLSPGPTTSVIMKSNRTFRTLGVVFLIILAVAGLGTLVMRDQISRHKRNLFSAHAFRRFAALSYLSRLDASIDLVHTLRDFVAREQRTMLRNRAQQILERMERTLARNHTYGRHAGHGAAGEFVG